MTTSPKPTLGDTRAKGQEGHGEREGEARCHVRPPSVVARRNPPAALPAIQPCAASAKVRSRSDAPVSPAKGVWVKVRPPSAVRVYDQSPYPHAGQNPMKPAALAEAASNDPAYASMVDTAPAAPPNWPRTVCQRAPASTVR